MTKNTGFTLVELMLALVLGGLLLTGFVSLHGQAGAIVSEVEITADMQDTVRLAFAYLETDLLQAGFVGSRRQGDVITGTFGPDDPVTVTVSGDCGANFSLDLSRPVAGRNGIFDLACGPYGGAAVGGSDVLIVRRADSQSRGRDPGRLQLATALSGSQLLAPADVPDVGGAPGDPTEIRDLVVSVYYLSRRSSGETEPRRCVASGSAPARGSATKRSRRASSISSCCSGWIWTRPEARAPVAPISMCMPMMRGWRPIRLL